MLPARGIRWALGREPVGVPQLRCTSIAYGTRAPRENGRNRRRGCALRHSVCPRRRSDELGICVGRVRAPLTGDVVHAQGDEADHHRGVRENDRDGQLARLRRFHGRDIPRDRVHDAYRRARAPRAMREKGCSPADTNSLERRKNFHNKAAQFSDRSCPNVSPSRSRKLRDVWSASRGVDQRGLDVARIIIIARARASPTLGYARHECRR